MSETLNHPFYEVAAGAKEVIDRGGQVFQKFTCSSCGKRLAMDVPNVFYKTGSCDKCGAITNIEETGCNFLVFFEGA
jgi:hypothetical protein